MPQPRPTGWKVIVLTLITAIMIVGGGCISDGSAPSLSNQTESCTPDLCSKYQVCAEAPISAISVQPGCETRATIQVRVENVSSQPQTIQVMECSKVANWQTDNPRVSVRWVRCWYNPTNRIELSPGGAYKDALELSIDPAVGKEEVLRVGFNSGESKRIYWSDKIVLHFEPSDVGKNGAGGR